MKLSESMTRALEACQRDGALIRYPGGYWHGASVPNSPGLNRPPFDGSFGTNTIRALLERELVVGVAFMKSGDPWKVEPKETSS